MRNDNIRLRFKKDNTKTVILVATILIGLSIILMRMGFMSVYATKGDEIFDLTQKRTQLIEQNKSLETEIAGYQSLPRIEKEAKDRLGMVKASAFKYLDLTK